MVGRFAVSAIEVGTFGKPRLLEEWIELIRDDLASDGKVSVSDDEADVDDLEYGATRNT